MRRVAYAAILAAGIFGLHIDPSGALEHVATPGQDAKRTSMQAFGDARPPFGYVSFCQRYPEDCAPSPASASTVELTPQRWREMVEINELINALVDPVTDAELYDTVEYWTYPAGRGDCEDYVLAKRRLLVQYGWPSSALRITVVRDEDNLGHAVLTVVTDQGDYVLDNKTSEILPWQDKPYTFQKRQSAANPLVWESLNVNDELRQLIFDPVAAR